MSRLSFKVVSIGKDRGKRMNHGLYYLILLVKVWESQMLYTVFVSETPMFYVILDSAGNSNPKIRTLSK